jgi:hypothetical protein
MDACDQQYDHVFGWLTASRFRQIDLGPAIVLGNHFEEDHEDRDQDSGIQAPIVNFEISTTSSSRTLRPRPAR